MAARTTILFAITGYVIVHISALFKGQALEEVWLVALGAMVIFAVIGFFIGWAFEALIKETVIQEQSLLFSGYLEKNPEAGGEKSFYNLEKKDGDIEEEDENQRIDGIEGTATP